MTTRIEAALVTATATDRGELLRFQERARRYDAENRFFTEDFEELRDSGYLLMAVPTELGGQGMTLAEVCAYWACAPPAAMTPRRGAARDRGDGAGARGDRAPSRPDGGGLVHRRDELAAKLTLGISPDEQPRWE